MASHRCAAWSPFGHKASGLDVPFIRAKDKVQSRSISTKNVNIPSNLPQTFDVDQIRLKEFDGKGLKYYNLNGRILKDLSGESVDIEPMTSVVDVSVPALSPRIIQKALHKLRSEGVISIEVL